MENFERLKKHLEERLFWNAKEIEITPMSGGFSNLTYRIDTPLGVFALRRPPYGNTISTAHDMERECRVLDILYQSGYRKIPKPVLFFEDSEIIGSTFFIMEFVQGPVLRNRLPDGISFSEIEFRSLSENSISTLLELHLIDINLSGLINLGKPDGYVKRQVEGWIYRYQRAKTDLISQMEKISDWLTENMPQKEYASLIHNDFKYDNLILNPENPTEIKAVMDWEMATVGDPLMDLGTTLAYWAEKDDSDILKQFNLTYKTGNMTREEVIGYYNLRSPLDLGNMLYYYVFGLFKVAVIAQQIYKRYADGYTQDPRFGGLIHVVRAASEKAEKAILTEKI
jgi:aminoglycoside phosphotransferase (APT) family kinase protein